MSTTPYVPRRLRAILAAALALAGVAPAQAETDLAARRSAFRDALAQAERGSEPQFIGAQRALLDHPLAPYLDYAWLRGRLDTVPAERVEAFLARHGDLAVAPALRNNWLRVLMRREDWTRFAAHDPGRHRDAELRCAGLQARLATAGVSDALLDDALATWLSGQSLPGRCDPVFEHLAQAGRLTDAVRWQRIDLAADAGNTRLLRFLARDLPPTERARAEAYADFLDAPSARAADWPADDRARRIAVLGLVPLAKRDAAAAGALVERLRGPLKLDDSALGLVLSEAAIWRAARDEPDAAAWFARIPAAGMTERAHEWRLREALARADWSAAAQAADALPAAMREDPRWAYLGARASELAGDAARARTAYAGIARSATFHGFLAADRLGLPYALCPREPHADTRRQTEVAGLPGLRRALELHALGRHDWARLEWDAAVAGLDAGSRVEAVRIASDAGWFDRAVFTLSQGEDMRLYALRFPLAHPRTLRAAAQDNGLDAPWVAGLIRAESAWMRDARSSADARGLMQLLPGTGAQMAKATGQPWNGPDTLYRPLTNIRLGTAYLGRMLRTFDGRAALATAAYNAGPAPVLRWMKARPLDPIDIWVETIPYRETREYVARVLAFSVIYDWRLGGTQVPLSARLDPARSDLPHRGFACPSDTPPTP